MTPTWSTALTGLGVILVATFVLWLISLPLRNASLVDPFWGFGFTLLAWLAYACQASPTSRSLLQCGLVTLWGVRLGLYLLWRTAGQEEDSRYALMRRHHGPRFWWVSLFTVFLLQGVILWVVSLPILVTASASADSPWSAWDAAGVGVWCLGLVFESVGDLQLVRFKAKPANDGKVLRQGLWRYTRHPNYFGDFCIWWGLYLIAVAGGAEWTVISPILMSILLMRISGVTLLEATIQERRPEYADYQQTTNAFFPGFPKEPQRPEQH